MIGHLSLLLFHFLRALRAAGHLGVYPPLVEAHQSKVAQAEHTLYLGPEGVEVLTR